MIHRSVASRTAYFFVLLLVLSFASACEKNESDDKTLPADSTRTASVKIETGRSVARVDERFLSVAVDSSQVAGGHWWSENGNVEVGTGQDKVDPFDFSRQKLRNMARELAPAFLRIGGSEADKIYYDMNETPVEAPPKNYELIMTKSIWDGVNDFAGDTGFDVFFTLNAGPGPRDWKNDWQPDNARHLIEYTVSQNYPVSVWELGNEINAFAIIHGVDLLIGGGQYADDFTALRTLVDEVDPASRIAGPSSAFWPVGGEILPITQAFLKNAGSIVDIVTWHFYPQQSRRCPLATRRAGPDVLLTPRNLDEVSKWAEYVEGIRAEHSSDAEVWLGETGNAQCGGEPGVSDAFVGGLWWLDELGLMARRGEPVVVRQTLAGSNYGLIEDATLSPNPDYWNSVLWKRLMGSVVLNAGIEVNDPYVRIYAHCAKESGSTGGVTVLAINLSKKNPVELDFEDALGRGRIYAVTAPDYLGKDVILNGTKLELAADGSAPDLTAADANTSPVRHTVPPTSYSYIVFPEADAPACR